MDSGFDEGGSRANGQRGGYSADGAVTKQSDQSPWLDLFAPHFVDRRLQIHEGYARGSLLVWRKNLRRHCLPSQLPGHGLAARRARLASETQPKADAGEPVVGGI